MGLSEGRAALNDAITTGEIPSGPPSQNAAPETISSDVAPEVNSNSESMEASGVETSTSNTSVQGGSKQERQSAIAEALLDLDKNTSEKILFQGKEWTKKDLQNAFLRQEDYSRKTMALSEQRRASEQEQKYADNFAADVQHVINNPELLEKFKELYPARYHGSLERILQNVRTDSVGQTQGAGAIERQTGQSNVDPVMLKKLQAIETEMNFFRQQREENDKNYRAQEVATAEAEISSTFDKLSKKYPMADEVNCINAGQMYLDQNPGEKKVPEKVWDNIFKSVNDMHTERYKAHYREQIKNQKLANSKGKDTPAGGGTPGSAPVKMRLKDVGDYAANMLSGKS